MLFFCYQTSISSLFLILNGLLVNDVVNISVNNAGLWRRKKEDSANEEGSHTICVFIAFFFTFISKQLRHNEVSLSASKGKVARRRRYKANAEGREGEIPLFFVGLGFNYTA